MAKAVKHGVVLRFKRKEFDRLLGYTDNKSYSVKSFYEELVEEYKVGIAYTSFMNILNNNRESLDALIIWAIAQKFDVPMEQLFEPELVLEQGDH